MNQYQVCILYGDYVDLFECTFIFGIGILRLVSNSFVDGMCVVALAPAANTMNGATFQPLAMTLFMSG